MYEPDGLNMDFNPGLNIKPLYDMLDFEYGKDVFGPPVEKRYLKDIRQSLKDPNASGPEIVYAIAMDVGKKIHRSVLYEKMLLFGVVTYAGGQLGEIEERDCSHQGGVLIQLNQDQYYSYQDPDIRP